MSVATALVYDIRFIAEVKRQDRGACIAFTDGSAGHLELSHPNFSHLLWIADWSRSRRPVGFVADAGGQLLDLNSAHDTAVHWIREFVTDHNRFAVAFWAYSPVCGLTRAHPDFERIHTTLTEAVRTSQGVWVVTHSEETVEDEPAQDGSIAALPKILDVRPASAPTNGQIAR